MTTLVQTFEIVDSKETFNANMKAIADKGRLERLLIMTYCRTKIDAEKSEIIEVAHIFGFETIIKLTSKTRV